MRKVICLLKLWALHSFSAYIMGHGINCRELFIPFASVGAAYIQPSPTSLSLSRIIPTCMRCIMAGMMKAAICKEAKTPLVIEDVPIPEPTGREIRVRVKAASLCHSDLTVMSGKLSWKGIFPVIPGHEAVSVVDKLGPEAAASYGFREGDLVGATLWHNMCMTCVNCQDVGPENCSSNELVGFTRPGYFAEFTLVDAANAVVIARGESGDTDIGKIPSPTILSPLFCAGVTVWDALERAHLHPGETVAVIGAGGLGELAIRYSQALGGYTLALDVRDEQLQACKCDGGADETINTGILSPEAVCEEVRRVNKGRAVDVAIVTASAVAAYHTALDILRPEGRLVVVGMPTEPFPLSLTRVGAMVFQIIGARAPGRISTEKCLEFSLRKKILPRVNPRIFRLEEINEMVALMEAGQVQDGRMVIEFP